jgi:hypothetical protein
MTTIYRGRPTPLKRLFWAVWGKPYRPQKKRKEIELERIELDVKRKKLEIEKRRLELDEERLEVTQKEIDYNKTKYDRKIAEEQATIENLYDNVSEDSGESVPSDSNSLETEALNAIIGGVTRGRSKGTTREDRGQTKLAPTTNSRDESGEKEIAPPEVTDD